MDKNKWIACEDRMPTKHQKVLVYQRPYMCAAFYDEFNERWVDQNAYIIPFEERITHWMPLPPAPTEKGGEK